MNPAQRRAAVARALSAASHAEEPPGGHVQSVTALVARVASLEAELHDVRREANKRIDVLTARLTALADQVAAGERRKEEPAPKPKGGGRKERAAVTTMPEVPFGDTALDAMLGDDES